MGPFTSSSPHNDASVQTLAGQVPFIHKTETMQCINKFSPESLYSCFTRKAGQPCLHKIQLIHQHKVPSVFLHLHSQHRQKNKHSHIRSFPLFRVQELPGGFPLGFWVTWAKWGVISSTVVLTEANTIAASRSEHFSQWANMQLHCVHSILTGIIPQFLQGNVVPNHTRLLCATVSHHVHYSFSHTVL